MPEPITVSLPPLPFTSTTPQIKQKVWSGKTSGLKADSLSVVALREGTEISRWRLKSLLMVEIRQGRKEFLASIWLGDLLEYGAARDPSRALEDLVVSLGEYMESLSQREGVLGDSARKELEAVRKVIQPI